MKKAAQMGGLSAIRMVPVYSPQERHRLFGRSRSHGGCRLCGFLLALVGIS